MRIFGHMLCGVLAACALAGAQEGAAAKATKAPNERQIHRVLLGRHLFENKELSGNGQVSCATCHDLSNSFQDSREQSEGLLGFEVGRNAPTLYGIANIKRFPAPKERRRRADGIKAVNLIERCLAPIENPIEMGADLQVAVRRLRKSPAVVEQFRRAYGTTTITPFLIGVSLATYLAHVKLPNSDYGDFLEGDQDALDSLQLEGYEIFRGKGQCNACHSGKALSDGLMHVALPPGGERALAQRARGAQVSQKVIEALQDEKASNARQARKLARIARRSGNGQSGDDCMGGNTPSAGYGGGTTPGDTIEFQTLSLWDVARTAPYFRDGSVNDLQTAVAQHITELQKVAKRQAAVDQVLSAQARQRLRPPQELLPGRTFSSKRPSPSKLDDDEMMALLEFLGALTSRR